MRYRILASFQGAQYEAGVGPDEPDVVLFAACPPPEELRFEPATGHWRKRVSRHQVQTLFESRPVGLFRGERCIVLDDLGDRLHIVYLGHDALRAAQLGYWEVDRGVFELITPRHEVTDIVEQRLPLPIRGDSGQRARPEPMPSGPLDNDDATGGNGVPFSTGRPRSEPRQADQSDVAIPLVPEPPLPLEAEALRAASSAARRGQKNSQSRQAQDARATRRLQPAVEPGVASPDDQATAAPAQVPNTETEVREPAAEVSLPLPAPVPAAAMLSKAAMLSHAAATAARQAGAPSKRSNPPVSPTAASGDLLAHGEQASQPRAETAPPAPLEPGATLAQEPAAIAQEPAGVPAAPEAAAPLDQAAEAPAHADQPAAEVTPSAPAPGPAGLVQDALSGTESASPEPAPVPAPLASPAPEQDRPESPSQDEQATLGQDRQTSPEPAEPATPAEATPDHADGATGGPPVGISDPPNVAHPPPAASAVPSWTPPGPVQLQPGFDAAPPPQPPHDLPPAQAGYYAPYAVSEPGPPNGITTANGAAAGFDFGLAELMPIPHPDLTPPPTLPAPPETPHPADESREPPAQAETDPGTATRRRRGTKRRLPTQKIFSDLATQAAIPAAAYAIGEEVDGAMCLMRTDEGFEVFNAAAGARHEVRVFEDEESAYFYLFGVLVAESVRTGALVPRD